MEAAVIAFAAVFVAELGDKSQFVALTFAARHSAWAVLAGVAVACALLQALAVGAGAAVSEALPERTVEVAAGVAFLAFAVWTLRADDHEDSVVARPGRSVALAAGTAFFIAEFGDKTQLATLALASANGVLGTWVGATVGEVLADALAVFAGARLGARLPERPLRLASALAFVVFGVLLLVGVG